MNKPDDVLPLKRKRYSEDGGFHPTKETLKRWDEEEERWRQEGLSEYEIMEKRFRLLREKYGENVWM